MKYIMLVLAIGVAGFLAYQEFKPVPPPPPPPPPPAILSEPAPVINEAEQAKILKSADDQDPQVRWEAVLLLDKDGLVLLRCHGRLLDASSSEAQHSARSVP